MPEEDDQPSAGDCPHCGEPLVYDSWGYGWMKFHASTGLLYCREEST